MWHQRFLSILKWSFFLLLGYVCLVGTFTSFNPDYSHKLPPYSIEEVNDGKFKILKEDGKEILKLSASAFDSVATLFQLNAPTKNFINIDNRGNFIVGIFAPYLILFIVLFFYYNTRRKLKLERELRWILLHELEDRFRARGSSLHDAVINPLKGFAERLPETLLKQLAAQLPEDDAMILATQLHEPLRNMSDQISQMANQAHEIYRDIAPPIHLIGLKNTIETYIKEIEAKNPNLVIEKHIDELPYLETRIGIQAYRILQEAIGNSILHGKTQHLSIALRKNGNEITLAIQDKGVGFEMPKDIVQLVRMNHTGIANMQYRAESIGAKFQVVSTAGKGTSILVTFQQD